MIAPFLASVTDNSFKTVCQMKRVISTTLPQSESIIPTTSERYSAPLCLGLNTKVDIKGEKGKPSLIENPPTSMNLVSPPPNVLGPKYE